MKMINYLLVIALAGVFALAGCGKSGQAPPPGVVTVDIKKLQESFPSPTPQVQISLDKLKFLAAQGRNEPLLVELENMSRFPNLTDPQMQAIGELIEQVRKGMAAAAKPAQ